MIVPLQEPTVINVHPEAADAIDMFLRCGSQWRTDSGEYLGLDYKVLVGPGGLFDLYGVKDPKTMLEDIQLMESSALLAMREAA